MSWRSGGDGASESALPVRLGDKNEETTPAVTECPCRSQTGWLPRASQGPRHGVKAYEPESGDAQRLVHGLFARSCPD